MGALGGPLEIGNKLFFHESEKIIISSDAVHIYPMALRANPPLRYLIKEVEVLWLDEGGKITRMSLSVSCQCCSGGVRGFLGALEGIRDYDKRISSMQCGKSQLGLIILIYRCV